MLAGGTTASPGNPGGRRLRTRDPRKLYLQRLLGSTVTATHEPVADARSLAEQLASAGAPHLPSPAVKPASPQIPEFVVGTAQAPTGLYFRALEQAAAAKRTRQPRKARRRGEIRDISSGKCAVRGSAAFGLLDGQESLASSYGTYHEGDSEDTGDDEGGSRDDISDFTGGARDSDDAEVESLTDIFYATGSFSPPGSPCSRPAGTAARGTATTGAPAFRLDAAAEASSGGSIPAGPTAAAIESPAEGGGAGGAGLVGRGRLGTLQHIEEEEDEEDEDAEDDGDAADEEDCYGGFGELESSSPGRRTAGL